MSIENSVVNFGTLRKHAGVTVTELASQLGFAEAQITEWEEGRSPAPKHVLHILDYMSAARPAGTGPDQAQHSFLWGEEAVQEGGKSDSRTGAFTDNMKLPIHRWFRYSAGFSAAWVSKIVCERRRAGLDDFVFDPFAGSGTSLLAAQAAGVASAGAERHPFVYRVAQAKLGWDCDSNDLRVAAEQIITSAKRLEGSVRNSSELLARCYSPDALTRLVALRSAFVSSEFLNETISELIWLALTSVLRECSGVGTAQWQYVLPNKTKSKVVDPYSGFIRRTEMFAGDIVHERRSLARKSVSVQLHQDDARELGSFENLKGRVSCVLTSPPYPNNFDYADATRLEMTFWGEVESWGDLQHTVRHRLVRSCSQHSAAERLELDPLLANPVVEPIRGELSEVCRELARIRETRAGKKSYHTMVAAYFCDLARVWHSLRPLCDMNADVCFVIGDSAPYGVYVPVDRWFTMLAEAAGFHSARFEKIRDRNLKWKNRKHRVPLKEGNLWLKG